MASSVLWGVNEQKREFDKTLGDDDQSEFETPVSAAETELPN